MIHPHAYFISRIGLDWIGLDQIKNLDPDHGISAVQHHQAFPFQSAYSQPRLGKQKPKVQKHPPPETISAPGNNKVFIWLSLSKSHLRLFIFFEKVERGGCSLLLFPIEVLVHPSVFPYRFPT